MPQWKIWAFLQKKSAFDRGTFFEDYVTYFYGEYIHE